MIIVCKTQDCLDKKETLTKNMGIRHRRWTDIADPACAGDSKGKYPLGFHSTAVEGKENMIRMTHSKVDAQTIIITVPTSNHGILCRPSLRAGVLNSQ